jgi:hypothetical protein
VKKILQLCKIIIYGNNTEEDGDLSKKKYIKITKLFSLLYAICKEAIDKKERIVDYLF